MTEQDQFLRSIAKRLAASQNVEIAVNQFMQALKAELNESDKSSKKENVA